MNFPYIFDFLHHLVDWIPLDEEYKGSTTPFVTSDRIIIITKKKQEKFRERERPAPVGRQTPNCQLKGGMVPLSTFRTRLFLLLLLLSHGRHQPHTQARALTASSVCAGLQRRGWNPVTDWRDLTRKIKEFKKKGKNCCLPACLFILPKHTLRLVEL